ncbi:uncharacterized protein LY89DRAFT_716658 [Mollisia scopiformis]|uniref:Uncharacterized protein n=1 Tax=Mollisia scopiformis TaxID=149040 RepID=A0A194XFU6_MOLSC|nr:uncharacterized protein LY89DRAFT_716658 [Mollisia scopiformis]KUJ19043.1 hypothetical protein LY89DRAFT_716658 [Mollisia scopiformis]
MLLRSSLGKFVFLISGASCARQHFPRATLGSLNATTTSDLYPIMPTCCYLDSFGVGLVLWWTSSVEVTVATISTIVYQYDNTAVTSYKTIKANNTQSLPTGVFNNFGTITISGVPTNIIGDDLAGYEADTTLITGTEFTDPYGVVYTSPTPVWVFSEVTYYTEAPTTTGSGYACPTPSFDGVGDGLQVYPSGYFQADNDTSYWQNNTGEIFKAGIPIGVKYWVEDHIPPNNSDDTYSEIGNCTMGFGDGIPTAHIPVTELTASAITTTTMTGNLGGISSTEASSVLPASSTGPGETNSSPGLGSDTTTGNPPGGTESPSSSSGVVTLRTWGQKLWLRKLGIRDHSGSGGGSNSASAGNGNGGGSESTAAGAGSKSSQTTGVGVGSGGNGITITSQPSSTIAPIFTAKGVTFTGDSATGFLIGSLTLTPGGTVVVSGSGTASLITYVLPTSGSAVIVNGVTEALSSKTVAAATTTPFIVIGSSTYIANSAYEYVIESQTLTAGGVVTASGETLSLASGGQTVVVVSGTSTKTESLGGIIASVGGFKTGTATPSYITASKGGLSKILDFWVLTAAIGTGLAAAWPL